MLAGDGDFAPAIFCAAKESHRKTQARWMAHRKGYGKASLRKGGAKKGGGEQRTLSTGTLCAKESHRKTQARWMAHRKGYGKASLRKGGAKKGGASNVRCLSAFRAQKVSINVRAMHERHLHKTALSAGAG